jgi:8-oxo-dGTP pyrophosphatase MutT (NUDIX family)
MRNFDWTVRKSSYILKDHWITVRADTCEMPSGQTIEPFYVLEYPAWVNVVALTADDDVILVRQYRHGLQETILGLPSGTVEPEDASPLEAAKRELREETGYASDRFMESGRLSANPATHTNLTYCYVATDVQPIAVPRMDDTEPIELVVMPLQAVFEQVVSGKLPQSLHVGSLFLALAALDRLHLT